MLMEQEHDTAQQPSLLARVLGSRIAQGLGIFGVAFALLQGLETSLQLSRLMAFLVDHWREYTRGLWSWLGSFFHLEVPPWASDLITLIFLFGLFTLRVVIYSRSYKSILEFRIHSPESLSSERLTVWLLQGSLIGIVMAASMGLMQAAVVVTLNPHLGMEGAIWAAFVVVVVYFTLLYIVMQKRGFEYSEHFVGLFAASKRSIFVLAGLLALNYIALYSHDIEAWFEKATQ